MVPHAATVGRNEELTAIEEFLGAVADGPAALVLEGEPGIGKTTLWQTGVNRARELEIRVLVASPVEAETKLSLSTLGDLLYGAIEDVLPVLPAPQRRALEIALLLEDGGQPPIDPRTLGVSLVNSLATLAESTPVLLAIDDVQWADPASATVLAFALRRLGSKRVSLLAAKLPEEAAATAQALSLSLAADIVRRLRVGPLSLGALHHLLSERLGLVLARSKLRRLHKLCAGNPFYGLELGRAIQRGMIRLEPGESPPSTLAALIQDRLAALPNETRVALLVASALSQPTLGAVARTAGGDPEERLAPALEARVVELDEDRILFTHPLLASGAYATAGPGERRELHRRLAHIVPDPEERARHLALGARGPDADVAARLEAAARRAHARGAMGAAAELSDLALRLTPLDRDEDRHQRAIQAADYAFAAGESGRAKEVLEEALASTPAGPRRARVLHGLGGLEIYDGNRRIAVDLFRHGLAEAGDDLGLRAQLEDRLASALFLMRTDLRTAARHAQTAVALAEKTGDVSTHVSALAEQGLIEALLGRAAWRVTLARGISLERQTEPVGLAHSASLGLATNLTWSDELDEARTILRSLRDLAEERAEESALPWILANLSLVDYLAGRWSAANRHAEDGAEIALQTDQEPQRQFALGVRALVRASRGEVDGARADAEAALTLSEERGVMIARILGSSAIALLELALGHYDAVHRTLGPLGERLEEGGVKEPGSTRFITDEIEALIGLGRLDEAKVLLERVEGRAKTLDRRSLLAACLRCRGLLAATRGDLNGALASLEQAVREHDRVPMPFDRARTVLALGSTQRRARQKRRARETLDEAWTAFEALGAQAWAELTQGQIARIGGRGPSTAELTPSERRVAALVAEGRSNKEVAGTLVITVKTVESHLSRIYAKLGLHSRAELAHRFATEKMGVPASKQ